MAKYPRDPIVTKIIALFNASGPARLKNRYFYGDPLLVPKSQLPAVFISKDGTSIGNEDVATDRSELRYAINVVEDLTRDFNQAFDSIGATSLVEDYLEGLTDDYDLKPTSLAYILRKNQSIGPHLYINIEVPLELDYGVTIGKRGDGLYTVEGVLKFEVTALQMLPGLS